LRINKIALQALLSKPTASPSFYAGLSFHCRRFKPLMMTIDRLRERRSFWKPAYARSALVSLAALATLSACASRAPTGASANVNVAGFPPAFKSGYADGCSSVAGTTRKDAARFKTDTQYAQGWRDGFDICRRR